LCGRIGDKGDKVFDIFILGRTQMVDALKCKQVEKLGKGYKYR
jgi:hypothetical protein